VVAGVLMSGIWKPEGGLTIYHVQLEWQNIARDILLLILAGASLKTTAPEIRRRNDFTWEPIVEVAKLFAGIFVSMIPAIAILRAGEHGALSSIIALVTKDGMPNHVMYFWLAGALSSFLDNAPTYLVFFNTAGGDAAALMKEASTLMAISAVIEVWPFSSLERCGRETPSLVATSPTVISAGRNSFSTSPG